MAPRRARRPPPRRPRPRGRKSRSARRSGRCRPVRPRLPRRRPRLRPGAAGARQHPTSAPRRAAASTELDRRLATPRFVEHGDDVWPARVPPAQCGGGGVRRARVRAPSAPRASSRRTASSTCAGRGPERTTRPRSCSIGCTAPTTVGLPASPQGPAPRSAALNRLMRSAGTAARPSGSTLHGSHRRSATASTAGSAISTSALPSSRSSSRRSRSPRSSRRRTPAAKGRSSSCASSGPTCPVSPSSEFSPTSTRSKGPAARARRPAPAPWPACRNPRRRCRRGGAQSPPPGNRFAQDVLRTRRAQRDHGARAAGLGGQRDPLGHGAAAVGVHLELDAVAHEAPLRHAHRLGVGDLLGQRRDAQRRPRGTPPAHRPTAAPSGLRGSDAATRTRAPPPARSTSMICAQPTATGSNALMARTRCPRAARPSGHAAGASASTSTVRSSPHHSRNGPAAGASRASRARADRRGRVLA